MKEPRLALEEVDRSLDEQGIESTGATTNW